MLSRADFPPLRKYLLTGYAFEILRKEGKFMRLAGIDWVIIAIFIAFITVIGFVASRKTHGKKEELLVAGRNVGMYVMLASVVAGE